VDALRKRNCLAGGTDIALVCDMILAARDAKIGFPAVRASGTPPINLWYYYIGPHWTKRMLMTGDFLCGRDAARAGLVLESHPAEELDAASDELARHVSRNDAELLSAQKRVVNMAMELVGAHVAAPCARASLGWTAPREVSGRHEGAGPRGSGAQPR
jgi:enoyl-CoA hydratase